MFRYVLHGRTIASDIPLPELRAGAGGPAALRIEAAEVRAPGPHRWFHRWRAGGRTCLAFARHDRGYLLRFPGMADFEISFSGRRVRCQPGRELPEVTLRHLLLDQIVPLALSRSRPLVLHASAVHVPRVGAVAFAGATGRGKSTIAAALAASGCRVLSDDCIVLSGPGSGPIVQPAYPGVRLWRDSASALGVRRSGIAVAHYTPKRRLAGSGIPFRASPSPLRALFVLGNRYRSGPACRCATPGPSERFMSVTRYLYLLDVADPGQLTRAFQAVAAMVASVPVFELRVVDDRRRLSELARDLVTLASGGQAHAA